MDHEMTEELIHLSGEIRKLRRGLEDRDLAPTLQLEFFNLERMIDEAVYGSR